MTKRGINIRKSMKSIILTDQKKKTELYYHFNRCKKNKTLSIIQCLFLTNLLIKLDPKENIPLNGGRLKIYPLRSRQRGGLSASLLNILLQVLAIDIRQEKK